MQQHSTPQARPGPHPQQPLGRWRVPPRPARISSRASARQRVHNNHRAGPARWPYACLAASHHSSSGHENPPRQPQHPVSGTDPSEQHEEFMVLLHELLPLSRRQLAAASIREPTALQASFLFWLQDLEKQARRPTGLFWQPSDHHPVSTTHRQSAAPHMSTGFVLMSQQPEEQPPTGSAWSTDETARNSRVRIDPDQVAQLAAELVSLREAQEQEAARRLLPSLASSLAYDNLARWRQETGARHGSVTVPGVPQLPVEQLYRLSEHQEQQLNATAATTSNRLGQQQEKGYLDGFAQRHGNEALAGLAAGAIARMRARFMGFEDGEGAADAVLDTLLWGAEDLGQRAEMVHTACTPPGLQYHPPPSSHSRSSSTPPSTPHHSGSSASAGLSSRSSSGMRGSGGFGTAAQPVEDWSSGSDGIDDNGYDYYQRLAAGLGAYARPGRRAAGAGGGRQAQSATGRGDAAEAPGVSQGLGDLGGADGSLAAGTLLCTTPQDLIQAIQARQRQAAAGLTHPSGPALQCGADMDVALQQLLEVVEEYDRNVWSLKSDLERWRT